MMTRQDIQNIHLGQVGLYEWEPKAPVVEVHEVQEVICGPKKGRIFRYVYVASCTGSAKIGFIVAEGDAQAIDGKGNIRQEIGY